MSPTLNARLLLLAIAVAGAVGIVDAVVDESWDHVVLFGVCTLLALVLFAGLAAGRQVVRLRADEVHWLARRARLGGESIDDVADRAVSTYRAALDPAPDEQDG